MEQQDEDHLRLLTIFHYIVGGLVTLLSLMPLTYVAFGWLVLHAFTDPRQGQPPPPALGWILIVFGSVLFLAGETLAVCIALSGRFIARRHHYWFTYVTACVQCLFIPFGTILGAFTIIVISRHSVKEAFGVERRVSTEEPES